MFPWQDFSQMIISKVLLVYLQPLFWLILVAIALQYRRLRKEQIKMFGFCSFSLWSQVLLAAGCGTVGGILGSFILTGAGVAVNQLGLEYIWPLAIALMFINRRFICFAYAGGLVAISNVLLGWPVVNVPQVLTLVAGLHIVESVLIYLGGRYSAIPLFLQRDDGQMVGAFNLQNFWPLPLVLLTAVAGHSGSLPEGFFSMPDWRPLLPIGEILPAGQIWLYGMLPVMAALGYADMAISSTPEERRRRSAFHLAIYSILLFVLAILSARYTWLQIIAAVLSPLGHELLIQLDSRREMRRPPLFVPPENGVMVFDALWNSPARDLGLKPGDILMELAGMSINNSFELAQAISFAPPDFELKYSRKGRLVQIQGHFTKGERRLGVILVPGGGEENFVTIPQSHSRLVDWLRRRRRP